jgi:FMN phosphatase YigB (HAD superfamily)
MRDDQLNYCSEIFAKESREFLGLELRDNLMEDDISLSQIRSWIRDFIRTNPDDKLIDEYPDFIWRVLDYQESDKRSSKMQSYKDAVKRYEIQERIDQSTIYSIKDLTAKMLVEWFAILESMNEREVVADLQLVYDNDFDRSEVYDLWKTIRIKFPKVVKKPIKTNAKQDWSDLWNEVKEEKELSPPF